MLHELLPSLQQYLRCRFDGLPSVELIRTARSCDAKFNQFIEEFTNKVIEAALPDEQWPHEDLELHDTHFDADELEASEGFQSLWSRLGTFHESALGRLGTAHGLAVCDRLFSTLAQKIRDILKSMVALMDKDLKLGKGGVCQALLDVHFLIQIVRQFELPQQDEIAMVLEEAEAYLRHHAGRADDTMLMGADSDWFEARAKEELQ